eukprot:5211461-Pyramimonas_sp.AAC.1
MPHTDRHEFEMRHWRELAELRAMMRRLLQTRAPNYHPAPRRPHQDEGQAVDDLQEGQHEPDQGSLPGSVLPLHRDTRDGHEGRRVQGWLATVNVAGAGSLVDYLSQEPDGKVFAVQEHRAYGDRLLSMQGQARDLGYHGCWSPASVTEAGGTRAGVAVLVATDTTVTEAPFRAQVDLPGDRFVAAHLHWGVPKGIVVMGVYLYDDQGLDADNMAIISGILKYVGLLNFLGMDWIVLGDWNLQPEVWADEWLEQ